MSLPEYLETIDPYVAEGWWSEQDYEEAVTAYLDNNFLEIFEWEIALGLFMRHNHEL
jgi:hypothetical protein